MDSRKRAIFLYKLEKDMEGERSNILFLLKEGIGLLPYRRINGIWTRLA